MSIRTQLQSKPRARVVVGVPVAALLARTEQLATGWAIGLLRSRPLERVAEIPWPAVAREAPALCAQAVRALESDTEVRRMTGGEGQIGREGFCSAGTLALLAGAEDGEAIVLAVEALRGVLWEALLDEMREPTAREVADLADRLAYVCAMIAAAAIPARTAVDEAAAALRAAQQSVHASEPRPTGREEAVIVDEWEAVEVARPSSRPPAATPQAPPTSGAQATPVSLSPWDTPLPEEIRAARTVGRPTARLDEPA